MQLLKQHKNIGRLVSLSLALILPLSLLSGCGKNDVKSSMKNTGQMQVLNSKLTVSENVPDYNTTYEIFLSSFYDSDGDGIGDINGVIKKLDYINDGDPSTTTDLGCNAIWLTPVCPSPTYHKYDVMDYEDIDSSFGTLEDYKNLIDECHKRGIKLIFDMVMNHSSSEHPWFTAACDYLKNLPEGATPSADENKYYGYYNFTTEKQDGYSPVSGTPYYYEARFWEGMPDLNLDNPLVQQEFKDIAKFWQDLGVDGFRMDACLYYYTGSDTKNIETLKWFTDSVRENNPSAYVVTEVWTAQSVYAKYYQSGINSTFDFAFAAGNGVIAKVTRGTKPASYYGKTCAGGEKLYLENATAEKTDENVGYLDAPFYTNHDIDRSAGYYSGDNAEAQIKFAGALNLLMSGNAFLYYGDELGMKGSGKDENKRAPMMWTSMNYHGDDSEDAINSDASDDSETTDSSDDESTEEKSSYGMCKGPTDMDTFEQAYPGLDVQEKDGSSIYEYFKEAIFLRNVFPVIGRGSSVNIECSNDKVGIVQKVDDNSDYEPLYIIINNTKETQTVNLEDLSDAKEPKLSAVLLTGEDEVVENDGSVTIPSYGIAVYTY